MGKTGGHSIQVANTHSLLWKKNPLLLLFSSLGLHNITTAHWPSSQVTLHTWKSTFLHHHHHHCHHLSRSRSGELRTQKLKSHQVRTQSWHVLSFKPRLGQYVAIHATLTARDFFLAISSVPVHSPVFFQKPLLISPVLAVANTWFLCRPAD